MSGGVTAMRAWVTQGDGVARMQLVECPVPTPAPDEVLLRVRVCGVCRTDLHVVNGELPPRRPQVVPGHEIVGEVVELGTSVGGVSIGERLGVAWLRGTCGRCDWCRRGAENLCRDSRYTGWDADGGYAEYATAPVDFAYRLPPDLPGEQAAPLLCAGIIGYRALRRANLPPGGRLGIYGFGASAHLTAQIAIELGAEVHVMTRDAAARELALELGAASASGASEPPPAPLDSAILFAPAGELVPAAMAALEQGGTLAVAGIHLSDIPGIEYQSQLFREKVLTSVTSNTRADGEELLRLAPRLGIRATTTSYPLDAAAAALEDLLADRVHGAAVIRVDGAE